MKKPYIVFLLFFFFCNTSLAETYYFKGCKLSQVASGNYIINLDKKIIEVTLIATDGKIQKFTDKIKIIQKDQIITEKIESGKGNQIYFEYYLNSKTNKIIKLQYKKQSGLDIDVFKIQEKKESKCSDVKGGWDKNKIEKIAIDKEQEQILKEQEKIKKEQSSIPECKGNNYKQWTNCKGTHKSETGHKYSGIFKDGTILNGIALFPGGAKYVGEFKNFKPHGYGNFSWANGDKYFGEWKDGKSQGNGSKIWNDGRKYSGTFINDKKTAAEPISFAFLDRTLLSIPILSTVVSIAELISSTISTNIRTLIINAISRPLCPNQIAIGIKSAPMAISSTKETWLVTALFNPSTEYIRL